MLSVGKSTLRRFVLVLVAATVVSTSLLGLIHPPVALAADAQYQQDCSSVTATQNCGPIYIYWAGAPTTTILGGVSGTPSSGDTNFSYVAKSSYDFVNGGSATIHVNANNPSSGTYKDGNGTKTISIGNTALFTKYFNGASSKEAADKKVIKATLTLTFDDSDPSMSVPGITFGVYAPGQEALSAGQSFPGEPNPADLTSATVVYSTDLQPIEPGKYDVCAMGNVIDNSLHRVCKSVTKQVNQVASVDLAAHGNASVLTADPNSTDNGDANAQCESSDGTGLGWMLCGVFRVMGNFSDWLFNSIFVPFLRTAPISLDPSDPSYAAWSAFRIYGDIFLVIALLVIVFGQAIGGGLIEAYTAKKALPRILAAAVLINLSIYIVAFLVDVTNVLGGAIGELMTAPLKGAGAFVIHMNGIAVGKIVAGTALTTFVLVLLGFISLNAVRKKTTKAGIGVNPTTARLFKSTGAAIVLFVVMPVVFGLLAALITLIIRKGLLIFLVMVSPVAFSLYCLPNTEQYFRKWWKLLVQTLLVYPIAVIFMAVADILSVTIVNANGDSSGLASLIAFLLQFLPLLFIPYSFKLAGGVIGSMHEMLTNYHRKAQEGIKGNPNDMNSRRNRVMRNWRGARIQQRFDQGQWLKGRAAKVSENMAPGARLNPWQRARKRAYNTASRMTYSANLAYEKALLNKQEAERVSTITGFGPDDAVRKAFATERNGRFYDYADPTKEVERVDVENARTNILGNDSAFQEGLFYEMTKAAGDDGRMSALMDRYMDMANREGWSEDQTYQNWIGPAYKNKGMRLLNKHRAIEGKPGALRWKREARGQAFGSNINKSGINVDAHAREVGGKLRTHEAGALGASDFGLMHEETQRLIQKVDRKEELTPAELEQAQYYYHGLTNLEYGARPAGDAAKGPSPEGQDGAGYMSFGASGAVAAEARKARESIGELAKRDGMLDKLKQLPPDVGNPHPTSLQ